MKRLSQVGWLMWIIILLPFLLAVSSEWFGLPGEVRYLLDVAWVLLFGMLLWRQKRNKNYGILVVWVILFFCCTVLAYLPQYQSIIYYAWGVRNNFRFFVVFFAFAVYLKLDDIYEYFTLFDALFWINFAVSLYQYFVMEISWDQLGGIFSTVSGGNGYTNIFFVIVLTKDFLFYIEKKKKLFPFMLKCMAALFVAALAELKFFFAEFVIILTLAILFTNFTWRKIWALLGGFVLVVTGSMVLASVFPNSEGFFSLEYFWESGFSDKGYTSSGDLNRLNAISKINELWLKTPWQRLFGLGLGNCDTSGFAIVNTPFFEAYGDMHYTWLSYAMIYLETGWIGLIFYYGFFVLVYFGARRIEKRSDGIAKTYCRMSRILAIMCMIIAVYNSSLRTEAGYMMFFALAIPFALKRERKEKEQCVYAEKMDT